MIAPALAENELERLTALYSVDFTNAELLKQLESVVEIVAYTFKTPIAYISSIDKEKQHIHTASGIDLEETERDISFCGHTILQNEPLIIPDALQDERFSNNPLVIGDPFIRFYAGFPISTPDGNNIGSLCISDVKPRTLTEQEIRIFKKFGGLLSERIRLFKLDEMQSQLIMAKNSRIKKYLNSLEGVNTADLIAKGESDHVEFKAALRWNRYSSKKDEAIEHASLKTIAAFLNSDGGTLFVGVNDEGKAVGLEADQFESQDRLFLHLTNLIKSKMGAMSMEFIKLTVEKYDGLEVLRVDCKASTYPVYLKAKQGEHFYIRTGPSSTDLRVAKIYEYIRVHFGENPIMQ